MVANALSFFKKCFYSGNCGQILNVEKMKTATSKLMTAKQYFEIYMSRRVKPKTVIDYISYLEVCRRILKKSDENYLFCKSPDVLITDRQKLIMLSGFKALTKGTQDSYLVAYDWLIACNIMIERNRIQKIKPAA